GRGLRGGGGIVGKSPGRMPMKLASIHKKTDESDISQQRYDRKRFHFPASPFRMSWLAWVGSTADPCSFMNAPMAAPNCFSVNACEARKSATNFSVSAG